MPIRISHTLLFLLLTAALPLSACASSAPGDDRNDGGTIRFVITPFLDDPSVQTPLLELKKQLEEATGQPVQITDVPSYSAAVEAIRAGHEDIALVSGFAAALAISTQQVEPLIAWPGDATSASQCIVLEDSPLQSLADITPETVVAFADPASESGYFLSLHLLKKAGLKEGEDFSSVFAGSHDRGLLALKHQDADVACTSAVFTAMVGQGSPLFPFEEGATRILGESIPKPIAASIITNAGLSEEKRRALLNGLPEVFHHDNVDELGVYVDGLPAGVEPVLDPGDEPFQPYLEIAALADVDLTEVN
ncbi:MAG: phosphate/phosphite/phosphonate ABC transporter substrate-binding protein [Corynebacterium sp.]|nr:phosphate/phosphite/phosphonate ABC transporter substrate-binding protein [Corynebacterium sp.]